MTESDDVPERPPSKMVRVSDSARQRELFRYYQPPSAVLDPSREVVVDNSTDTSLGAFAQLGALRLNTRRGIISLVGRDTEYIIAEAGRTHSLRGEGQHHEDDQLWHGVAALQSKAAVGLVAMDLLAGISQDPIPYLVVDDLSKDDRFSELPIVTAHPSARFLACVPLRTPGGYIIGLYTLIDDKPRNITEFEIGFLQDLAKTTMDHIHNGLVKQQHHRAERMVKALGLFLEGGESLRNWWINQGKKGQSIQQANVNEQTRRGFSYHQQADDEFGVQEDPDKYAAIGGLHPLDERDDGYFKADHIVKGDGRPAVPPSVSISSGTTTAPGTSFRPATAPESATSLGPPTSPKIPWSEGAPAVIQSPGVIQQTTTYGKRLQDALLSNELKRNFARASNLIREAIDVDGVAFFDASIGSFGGGSDKLSMNANAPGAHSADTNADTTSSGSESDKKRNSDTDTDPATSPSENQVSILGYSTRTRSSLQKHAVSEPLQQFPESLLRRLAKRHPHGKIFNFDEEGAISSSESEAAPNVNQLQRSHSRSPLKKTGISQGTKKSWSKEEEAVAIINVVPGSRSVIWFPIWDPSRERWYAGALIWSQSASRVFSADEEIIYMATFGNSIMSEVSRLSATVASQMKVDFISSISHELRSPLYGILASVEFLKEDSGMTDVNAEMIETINNCGNTLLQTIDHVLDFAKITKKVKEKPAQRFSNRSSQHSGSRKRDLSTAIPIDLRVLTENVIDSVYAGRRSWKAPIRHTTSTLNMATDPSLVIVLDISWKENWAFGIDDGAWRRILMNLFSNAVKYTKRGYVRVALSVDIDEVPGKKKPYPRLRLEVSDSGQGISQEFLRNHIYTAFKQEDSLSVGTGLGLSIVRQIILDLGGTIDIKSEVDVGTQAYVSIPLLPTEAKRSKEGHALSEIQKNTAGFEACLCNSVFDLLPAMSDEPTGILSPEAEALMLLKSSVRSILAEWFGMRVITSSKLDLNAAKVHITVASETVNEEIRAAESEFSSGETVTVIVICKILARNPIYETEKGVRVVYLQQPVSPQKFASVLSQTFHPLLESKDQENAATPKYQEVSTITHIPPNQHVSPTGPSSPISTRPTLGARKSSSFTETIPVLSNPLKILLVEDNEINLSLLVKCVSKLHYPYATATNGSEAVSAFKAEGPFCMVFMDIQMPVMDGLTASRSIRDYERESRAQASRKGENERRGSLDASVREGAAVVALTGAASTIARQEAFAAGMDLFLLKPVSMKTISGILKDMEEGGRERVRQNG